MRGKLVLVTLATLGVGQACGSSDVDVLVRSTGSPAALPTASSPSDDAIETDDAAAADEDDADSTSGDDSSADELIDAGQTSMPDDEPSDDEPSDDGLPDRQPQEVEAGVEEAADDCEGVAASLARYFRFKLRDDGRCMVLGEQLMGGNLPLYLPELTNACVGDGSLWQLVQGLDGAFEVRHAQVGLNLDVEMGSPDVGAPAVIVLPIGYPSQRWEFQPRAGDAAALRPLHTMDRCLSAGVTGDVELSLCVPGVASQEWLVEEEPCAQPQPLPPPSAPSSPSSP